MVSPVCPTLTATARDAVRCEDVLPRLLLQLKALQRTSADALVEPGGQGVGDHTTRHNHPTKTDTDRTSITTRQPTKDPGERDGLGAERGAGHGMGAQ